MMGKIFTGFMGCFLLVSFGQAAEWETGGNSGGSTIAVTQAFPGDFFWKAGDYDSAGIKEVTSLGEVTLLADALHELVIQPNSKTLGGESFSSRLKLGGAGKPPVPAYRALKFSVGGDCLIEIFALSSSSAEGETRTMGFSNGVAEIKTDTVPGNHIVFSGLVPFAYTGPKTDIYIYSKEKGLNIYGIRVTHGASGVFKAVRIKSKENLVFEIYNIKGAKILTTTNPNPNLKGYVRGSYIIQQREMRP